MPILENYRHYFDIDPDYFPAVNEAVINSKPDMWKKFFPPSVKQVATARPRRKMKSCREP